MVEVRPLELPGLLEVLPKRFGDDRGFFSEVWNKATMADAGIGVDFVQDNHSFSAVRGVLRGLHLQLGEHAQDKLVRVVRGAVWDVAVDVRPDSPTLGRWAALELSADRWNQLFAPKGFAHGFVTLQPDTEVLYKVSAPYMPEAEVTLRFDDPEVAIPWPLDWAELQLSPKDRNGLSLKALMQRLKGE
jgi:dTDP-4-dehydrorhamnose 3,5-epimerase